MEKIKSLRGGETEVYVNKRIRWPQEFVLAGSKKERVSYDSLSMGQWVVGFCRAIQEESNGKSKDSMLDYMILLLEDANDFSWQAAKASHAVLLCRMEQGEISDYTEVDKIDRIRRAHAQRHTTVANPASNTKKQSQKSMPCQYYNNGSCSENRNMVFKHICASCYKKLNKQFNHPESECRKIRTKND